ncbi:phage holin family protein [Enterococcus casseliflavus]|uniref:Holin n=1 Tax=Enterococcus casseliflavus TaxID=37734 RepID=A0A6N3EQ89_ENTCA|nr:phage holin family protein [Enterococcus casseliflavus]MRI70240.1 holin [Enterococcus casseliflavus]
MDLSVVTENFIPVIVIACLVVGYIIKTTPVLTNKVNDYIPLIVGVLGAVLGLVMNGLTVESIVYGAVSGLASTGLHQTFTRIINQGVAE